MSFQDKTQKSGHKNKRKKDVEFQYEFIQECLKSTEVLSNNFFIIIDGVAQDLGDTRPKSAERSSENTEFVIVREFKDGGNRARLFSGTKEQAIKQANLILTRSKDISKVIVGKSTGFKFKGKILYKDILAVKP